MTSRHELAFIQKQIQRTPLSAAEYEHPQKLARWMESVVSTIACGQPPTEQPPEITLLVVLHLLVNRVRVDKISAALAASRFGWELPPAQGPYAAELLALGVGRRFAILNNPQPQMKAAAEHDLDHVAMKAAEYEAKYNANVDNPTVRAKLIAALRILIDLAIKGQPMHDTMKARERIEDVRRQILLNAPNLGRTVQHLSPEELRRMRSAPSPTLPQGVRVVPPPRRAR